METARGKGRVSGGREGVWCRGFPREKGDGKGRVILRVKCAV